MRKAVVMATMLIAGCIFFGGTAWAGLQVVETSTDTLGTTEVSWSSGFLDDDYTIGAVIVVTVSWSATGGAVEYDRVALRRYTPKAKGDPAIGTEPAITYPGSGGANSVDISFAFVDMHLDEDNSVQIGNGHFKLYLQVDEDGDGTTDSVAGFGVNIHAEDPQ